MKNLHGYIRVLALAALVDWLISRTFTRAAIHMPKSEAMLPIYQGVNAFGQLAGTFVSLLAVVILTGIAWREWQNRRASWLSLLLITRIVMSLVFLVTAPAGWIAVGHHLLTLSILLHLTIPRPGSEARWGIQAEASRLLPALTLLAGVLYQLLPALFTALALPGPPPLTGWLYNSGELSVVLSVCGLWWVYGRVRTVWMWITAAIPAVLFTLAFLRDPAMTGILAIWSTGLSLILPWPIYALAVWLLGVTVLASWKPKPAAADALLLLTAAGFAPQLSPQLFGALIALWLLGRSQAVKSPVGGGSQQRQRGALASASIRENPAIGATGGQAAGVSSR